MRKGFADNKILLTVIVGTILILICFGYFRSAGPGDMTVASGEEETSANDKPGLIEEEEDESDENPDIDPDEDSYTKTLARANQTQNEGDAKLIERSPATKTAKKNYTVMVYMTGSDLEERYGSATADIEEMLQAGLNYDRTNLIVYTGGARRWNSDISASTNNVLDLSLPPEKRTVASTRKNSDMGSPDTLKEFLDYTAGHYPADRYALIFWDHGGGSVYGYGKDTLYKGDSLLLREMKAAVADSLFGKNKTCRLDWVGFDACLMATLENAVVWKDYTDYLVASEELESGDGWDYSFLRLLNEDRDTLSLCKGIVECFQDYYLAKRSDMFHPDITLSVLDLSKTDDAVKAVNALAGRMKKDISGDLFADIVRARVSAKAFGVIGNNRGGAFDLTDVEDLAKQLRTRYPAESDKLRQAVNAMVAAGTDQTEGACGVSMYFPGENRELYMTLKEQNTENMFLSEDFRLFSGSYADRWMGVSDADWKVGDLKEKNGEYLLQLSEEQAANLASAAYNVMLNYDKGQYLSAMYRISIKPDKNNILHIPKDPNLIYVKGTRRFCEFKEAESRAGRKVYDTRFMRIGYDFEIEDSIGIITTLEENKGKLTTKTVRYDTEDVVGSGKNNVDISQYTVALWTMPVALPTKDDEGNMLPLNKWNLKESTIASSELDYTDDGNIEFEYGKASEAEYPAVVQVVLQDVNGDYHASDIAKLKAGTGHKEEVISRDTEKGKMEFIIEDGEAALKSYAGEDELLEIPSEVSGYPVVAVERRAITDDAKELKELIIPEGVRRLDNKAVFLAGVEKICLPSSLKEISVVAFGGCRDLREFIISDKNPYFSADKGVLFSKDKKRLLAYPEAKGKKYRIPEGTEEIGPGAFAMSSIEEVLFPDSLTKIGAVSFFGCEDLRNLKLSAGLEYIGNGAFAFFYGTGAGKDLTTTTLTIGPKLSFIGKNAFYGLKFHGFKVDKANPHFSSKNGLLMTKTGDVVLECPFMIGKEVVVPDGTTGLNQGVFEKCSPTAVFYLPDSLVRMSKDDFPYLADSSEEEGGITIVCSKGSAAETFAYKNGLHTVPADSEIPEDNSTYEKTVPMTDGSCHFQVYSDHAALVCYRGCDTSVAVPEYVDGKPVTEIGDGKNPVFEIDHSFDKSPDSFDENDRGGDQNETVNNPSGVLRILMPDGIKRINKNAFNNVKFDVYDDADGGILALPAELEYISPQAFGDWSSSIFTGLSISENNKNYCSIDGVLFTKDRSTLVLFPSRIQTDSSMIREKMTRSGNEYFYYIPDGVKTIGDYAFKSLPYIRTDKFLHLIFPPSLETIGNHAFEYADLYDISLNEGLKVIGKKAFMSSDLLSDRLILPDSLKEIGDEAFARAYVGLSYEDFRYGFRHIELPEHLKTVGEDVFNQYGYYDNDKTIVSCDDLYIKTDLSEMKSRAFRGLNTGAFHTDPAHPRFASPEGLLTNKEQTVLLAVPNAWEGILEIPEGIEAVEADAFGGCSKITKIVFPNTVKTISGQAFDSMGTDPVICSDEDSFAREYARLHQMEWEEK